MTRKKRILFMPASCGEAHLYNCMRLGKTLAAEGHRTAFAIGNSLFKTAKDFGINEVYEVIDNCYLAESEWDLFESITERDYLERCLSEEKDIIEKFKPDLIVSDYRLTAGISAHIYRLPWVSMLAQLWYLPDYRYLLQDLYNRAGIEYMRLESINSECRQWAEKIRWVFKETKMPEVTDLMQLYISPFCTLLRTIPPFIGNCTLPENFHLVGPFFDRSFKRQPVKEVIEQLRDSNIKIEEDSKRIFLRLSGIIKDKQATEEWIEMLKKHIKNTKFQLIIGDKNLKATVCENILITSFLPFELIFQLEDIVLISSGGLNTTLQAMAWEVPHLIVPTQVENVYNGFTVRELGVAEVLALPLRPDPEETFDKINKLFTETKYKQSLREKKRYFQEFEGVTAAIECLNRHGLI